MKLTNEQKDIIKILVKNELEYYETYYSDYDNVSQDDSDFMEQLKNILKELESDK